MSQIGHATHVFWSTLTKEFDYCIHWVVWSHFQQFMVKVRSGSGHKDQISNFINFNKKGIYQMQVKLRIPTVHFILLCNVRNMFKFAFELYAFSMSHTSILKNEMSYKSAIFWHIKLKFSILVHLDGFYNIYSGFYDNQKKIEKNHKSIFSKIWRIVSLFFFNEKIRDSSSIGLSILCHAKKLVVT